MTCMLIVEVTNIICISIYSLRDVLLKTMGGKTSAVFYWFKNKLTQKVSVWS